MPEINTKSAGIRPALHQSQLQEIPKDLDTLAGYLTELEDVVYRLIDRLEPYTNQSAPEKASVEAVLCSRGSPFGQQLHSLTLRVEQQSTRIQYLLSRLEL